MVNELQYARMEFKNSQSRGNYAYVEYPKWVKLHSGTKVLVRNAIEETQILTDQARGVEPSPVEKERNELGQALQQSLSEMARLREQLAQMEAKIQSQENEARAQVIEVKAPVVEIIPEAPSMESLPKEKLKTGLASLAKS